MPRQPNQRSKFRRQGSQFVALVKTNQPSAGIRQKPTCRISKERTTPASPRVNQQAKALLVWLVSHLRKNSKVAKLVAKNGKSDNASVECFTTTHDRSVARAANSGTFESLSRPRFAIAKKKKSPTKRNKTFVKTTVKEFNKLLTANIPRKRG